MAMFLIVPMTCPATVNRSRTSTRPLDITSCREGTSWLPEQFGAGAGRSPQPDAASNDGPPCDTRAHALRNSFEIADIWPETRMAAGGHARGTAKHHVRLFRPMADALIPEPSQTE